MVISYRLRRQVLPHLQNICSCNDANQLMPSHKNGVHKVWVDSRIKVLGSTNVKQTILALSATVAALALAPSANATVTVICPGAAGSSHCDFDNVSNTGNYGDKFGVNTTFDDIFKVVLSTAGQLSITLTNTLAVGGPITFTTHQLTGIGNILGGGVANDFYVAAGTYDLHLAGFTGNKAATYAGTIDFAPVPEPATWAMMIAGFGLAGVALRRRSVAARNVSVSFV
jgi:hypothetical protein